MQIDNRMLDDLARMAAGMAGTAAGVKSEIEAQLRQIVERWLDQMDLVPREEFEAVKAMAAKAREEQEVLAERLAALEKQLATPAKAKPARRPAKSRGTGRRKSAG